MGRDGLKRLQVTTMSMPAILYIFYYCNERGALSAERSSVSMNRFNSFPPRSGGAFSQGCGRVV